MLNNLHFQIFCVKMYIIAFFFALGILVKVNYIPVTSISFFTFWLYLRIFYVPKNKVFGIRY
jgi:ABC-type multidrug transport system permease subunit